MKLYLLITLSLLLCQSRCPNHSDKIKTECKSLFQSIFNEDFFYEPEPGKKMNIVGIDTITILDKQNYLGNCGNDFRIKIDTSNIIRGSYFNGQIIPKVYYEKVICIKQKDIILEALQSFKDKQDFFNNPKYRCYFILKEFHNINDTVFLNFDRFAANDGIKLTYRRKGENWEILEKEIGKY